jgi:O-antigen/teichoic acid export membrane protein
MVMTMFVQAFRFAAEPFFFKESGSEQAPKTYADVLNWFVYACGFIYVATMVCLPWLAPFLLRKAVYYNDVRGMTVVPVLLMANLLLGMYYSISIWYRLSARTLLGALIAILGAGVTLVLNFLFIPKYGFIASAWATLAAYGFMVLLAYALGQRYFPVPYNVKRILFILFGAMILGMIAQTYNEVLPVLSYLAIPGYLLMIWYAEKGHYADRKNH